MVVATAATFREFAPSATVLLILTDNPVNVEVAPRLTVPLYGWPSDVEMFPLIEVLPAASVVRDSKAAVPPTTP